MAEEKFLFRKVFNERVIKGLATRIKQTYSSFDISGFEQEIIPKLDKLNYGARSKLITEKLHVFLPKDFMLAAQILIDSLEPELDVEPGKTHWQGFIVLPVAEYIAERGVEKLEYYEISMKALYEMTKRLSSEMAVRPFLRKYPKRTLMLFKKWTKDDNVHVRRLVSEGSRPRLPLSSPLREFQKDPSEVITLLELLKDDVDLYVRRSVANNLNDIAKDNPEIVVSLLEKWQKGATPERNWVIKHSLRTLLKQGNIGALKLLGYHEAKVKLDGLPVLTPKVKIGNSLEFRAEIISLQDQQLMIDYAIHYMKANGRHAAKVFKLAAKKCVKGQVLEFTKKHSCKEMTTRKHYPGKHFIEMIVNGKKYGKESFELEK